MNVKIALRLLGPLASQAVQRRYIVGPTTDEYILPTEILNDGYYFLRHPLGTAESLGSVEEFARAYEEEIAKATDAANLAKGANSARKAS